MGQMSEKTMQGQMARIGITMEASWSYKHQKPALASSRGKRVCAEDDSDSTGLRTGEEVHTGLRGAESCQNPGCCCLPPLASICPFFGCTLIGYDP